MAISGNVYVDEVVRVADLFTTTDQLVGYQFRNCLLVGPMIVAPMGNCVFDTCGFDGAISGMMWPLPKGASVVIGAVAFVDTVFDRCRFVRVGLTADEGSLDRLRRGIVQE